jgi:alkylhydroperoxidase/carboxymuconolactone decarboxylase family protein YurZ
MTSPAQTSQTPLSDQLKATGNWNSNWTPFEELDPVWTEKFMTMAFHPLAKNLLDAKTVEFISIAVDASCTHMYGPGVRRHIKKALELGASKEEILAVLQLTSVLGIHSLSLGAPMLQEEVAAFAKDQRNALKTPRKSTKNTAQKLRL